MATTTINTHLSPICYTFHEAPIYHPTNYVNTQYQPKLEGKDTRERGRGEKARKTYLWQINVRDNDRVQSARGILRGISRVSTWMVLVPTLSPIPIVSKNEGRMRRGGVEDLNCSFAEASSPSPCHGIAFFTTLIRLSSDVADVGFRPDSPIQQSSILCSP